MKANIQGIAFAESKAVISSFIALRPRHIGQHTVSTAGLETVA